jgi:hypothetical protein
MCVNPAILIKSCYSLNSAHPDLEFTHNTPHNVVHLDKSLLAHALARGAPR